MDKKEKEMRLAEHISYYDLIDKLRDMSLDALDDLSVDSVISALDRIKTELIQNQVIVEIEDSQKQSETEQSEVDNDSEELEVESGMLPSQAELKVESPFVNPIELIEQMDKGRVNN